MVYRIPSTVVSSLPLPVLSSYEPKQHYSLFKKVDGRWFQIRTATHTAEMACRVWADFVAANPLSYSIRRAAFVLHEAR